MRPYVNSSRSNEYGELYILFMLSRYTYNYDPEVKAIEEENRWENGKFRKIGLSYDVWLLALCWLPNGNAFRLFLPRMVPVQFQTNIAGTIEQVMSLIQRREAHDNKISKFFPRHYQRPFLITCLLTAALNADHALIERIFVGKNDNAIKALLSTSGTAVIKHLGIVRSGPAILMALYSHDEIAFNMLAKRMDPKVVSRLCQDVFDDYGVKDYNELYLKLRDEATALCSDLVEAVLKATPTDIANALEHKVSDTTSEFQAVLKRFTDNVEQYVRENSLHNFFILPHLVEFYKHPSNQSCEKRKLISQQPIGLAQKLSSVCWLQHIEDTYRHSSPYRRKIFSDEVLSRLGVDGCVIWKSISPEFHIGPQAIYKLCNEKSKSIASIIHPQATQCVKSNNCLVQ